MAIPVIIHLFNLRRYKTVFFPHTRFLKNIQLKSQKQSQVRYKLLLALRMLFLAALILAFAQPFFNSSNKNTVNGLNVIYVDNSASMSVKKGSRSLLDVAKATAIKQVKDAGPGARFILLSNDKPVSYQPMPQERVLAELNKLDISASSKTSAQVLGTLQGIMQSEAQPNANLYYYSDFQRNAFATRPDATLMKGVELYGVPVQAEAAQNIFIDTAYLNSPLLQIGQNNQLVVVSKRSGKTPEETPVLQLSINGQVKAAASPNYNDKGESIDTLNFQVNDSRWQQMQLTLNDASVRYDDTFRITARSAPNLSVLVLNEAQANPYIQAAFRAYNGFRLNQANQLPADLQEYNLIILNAVTNIDATTAQVLNTALQRGQTICIFPGRTANYAAINEGLQVLGDIRLGTVDTAVQTVGSLQQGSSLVRDMFERIPDNVQLPVSNWHYAINAGLSANQQSVLSFRNGDPFLALYKPSKGQLYITASSVDVSAGNFATSYFFAPFLYQMAMQSRGGDVYALTSGSQQAAYLPMSEVSERNMVHLYAPGLDVIPPQRPSGAGLDVMVSQAVEQPGFYTLTAAGSDSAVIALNQNRTESDLETWGANTLKTQWKADNIHWLQADAAGSISSSSAGGSFPLWKVCAILALVMLAAETFVLAGGLRKPNTAI